MDTVKLILFPFSIDGVAKFWLDKEPPRSIRTWEELKLKFINKFFPPSKTTNLRNEIINFKQFVHETFYEDWDRLKIFLELAPIMDSLFLIKLIRSIMLLTTMIKIR